MDPKDCSKESAISCLDSVNKVKHEKTSQKNNDSKGMARYNKKTERVKEDERR